jgi:protein O-GlcNAc transferase
VSGKDSVAGRCISAADELNSMSRERSTSPAIGDVQHAFSLHRQGRLAEAESAYAALLARQPRHFDALHLFGMLRMQQGRPDEALRLAESAARLRADAPEALAVCALALSALGRGDEALAKYDRLIKLRPSDADCHFNRGVLLSQIGRHAAALESYDRALAIRPDHAPALFNRANTLAQGNRFGEACQAYEKLLQLVPNHVAALGSYADALCLLGRHDEAVAPYQRALGLKPDHIAILNNYGNLLIELRRTEEALACFDRALSFSPKDPELLFNRGNVLAALERAEEALASYDRALAIAPDRADILNNRANVLGPNRQEEAIRDYERVLALDPHHPHVFESLGFLTLDGCNWTKAAGLAEIAEPAIADKRHTVGISYPLFYFGNPSYLQICARDYLQRSLPSIIKPLPRRAAAKSVKLRVAYISSDFRNHAVAASIVELLERHDRTDFEFVGLSTGRDDASTIRARIAKSFDRFHDVSSSSDRAIAEFIREIDVNIAVDLNGLTRGNRVGSLALRPAPVQVAYLGYASTTGADFIDYFLADPTVLPLAERRYFSENIIHLPDCYHPSDTTRQIAPVVPTLAELGLPENGFVFCCFNRSFKIGANIFAAWARILQRVPESVLWLPKMRDVAMANLRREFAARGLDPARLVFAPRLDRIEDHLARHRRADLFLDTLPYGAHSTALDALWAGLPVLTCVGTSFAGRVGSSLLKAVGLPEMITTSLDDYEALAVKLAAEPALLRAIRAKLDGNRSTCPLFDTDRLRRHIEAAYKTIWDIHQRGEAPRQITVEPLA